MKSKVLLVEDEPSAFKRCANIVDQHPRLILARQATGFQQALRILDQCGAQLDLLLTDLKLGDGDGAELIRYWRSLGGKRAMVITVFGDVDSVMRAVEAGADGYLLKSGSDYEMMTAITTVLDGGAPISAAVAGHLLRRLRRPEKNKGKQVNKSNVDLSAREIEILDDLARGQSYKEVARKRHISPHTVSDHVKKIYRKLQVGSRGEAVFKALQDGLINIQDEN